MVEILALKVQDFPMDESNPDAALDHVLYEMVMLAYAMNPVFDQNLPPHECSAWLEVFVLHARSLNEFFGKKNQRGDHMKPEHFVTGWSRTYIFSEPVKKRADEQVAHLTYKRETPDKKTSWAVDEIFRSLAVPCMTFLQAVHKNDTLMKFGENRSRTEWLLGTLPALCAKYDGAVSHANVATVSLQVGMTSTTRILRYPDGS